MKQNNINDIDLNIVSNEKKKIIIGIFSVLALVGVSLAYFFITKSSSLFNLNIKQQAEMNFLEGTENIMAKGIPIYDEDVSSDASYSIFSITNPGTTAIHANIYLEDINMSSDVFVSDDFKWSIEEGTGLTNEDFSDDYDNSVSGSFLKIDETDPTNKKVLIARNVILEPNETKYYKVRVWLRETGEDQTAFMGENIELKVSTSADSVALANASGEEVILTNTAYNSSVSNLKIYGNTVDGVSVGDKTKNLLNPVFSTRLWAAVGTNIAITSDVSGYSQIVKVEPNTSYTISGNCIGMNSNTLRIAFTKEYPDVGVTTIAQRQQIVSSSFNSLTITTPEECNYLLLMTGTSQIYDYTDNQLQLEKGTTATEYEPYGYKIPITVSNGTTTETSTIYLNEPLRKVGEYADYLDLTNGKVTRNIKEIVFTGSENWIRYGEKNTFYVENNFIKHSENIMCYSNKYKGQQSGTASSYSSGNMWIQSTSEYPRIYISDDNYTSITSFKSYLASNNVIGHFVLDTPTEETVEISTIPSLEGNITYIVGTSISPSNINYSYK